MNGKNAKEKKKEKREKKVRWHLHGSDVAGACVTLSSTKVVLYF